MNRNRYRLVRNRSTLSWAPVPEFARGCGTFAARAVLLAASLLPAVAGAASALPVPCVAGACGVNPAVPGFASPLGGAASYSAAGNQAMVNQVGSKAVLNWQSFNVGRGNTVTFRQVDGLGTLNNVAGANFSTLNRIWQADPSVIAGAINVAAGQKGNLTFINQNGIVFTGTAQVNVNTLTASSLDMKDKFFTGALTPFGNSEAQFEGGGGFVSVLEGARISTANGGRVMLLAPSVSNRGRIETPDGQTILAAGSKAYLAASQDPNLRGFLVEVDSPAGLSNATTPNASVPATVSLDGVSHAVADSGSMQGHASNSGVIQTGTGNATMVGYAVNQLGQVSATNSVVFNGSIYLTAKDTKKDLRDSGGTTVLGFASTRGGQLRVGENSRTAIMPALDERKLEAALSSGVLTREAVDRYLSGDASAIDFIRFVPETTSLDSQTFSRAQIRIVGQDVQVGAAAVIRAPAGQVSMYALDDPSRLRIYDSSTADLFETANSGDSTQARVTLGAGSSIDVSGLGAVPVSVARNFVEVRLQGDELKDSPVNRDGAIRGQKVWLDVNQGSALVSNAADYKGQIGRGIAERSTEAGAINLNSQGEVRVGSGVVLDVSGGSVDFTAALTKRTQLSLNGKLVDLAKAEVDVLYDGIASRYEISSPRWGITRVYGVGEDQFNPGYAEGKDAGSVAITGRRVGFEGTVQGRTLVGEFQAAAAPDGAALQIGKVLGGGATRDHFVSQNVVIGGDAAASNADTLILPQSLFGGDGVNRLELYSNNAITIDQPLRLGATGSVKVSAESVSVNAGISAPGGVISLTARENLTTVPSDLLNVSLGNGVILDVSGQWINDGLSGIASTVPRAISGGNVTLSAVNNLVLGEGSGVNIAGGAFRDLKGKVSAGDGGGLAADFLQLTSMSPGALTPRLYIDAAGLGKGGSLALSAQRVDIGISDSGPGILSLDPQFFRQGFSSYSVTGLQGLELNPDTQVTVRTASRELLPSAAAVAPTGTDIRAISTVAERTDELRRAASVSLKSGTYLGQTSTLSIDPGASLEVDPGAKVGLSASGQLNISGRVSAPGGSITATLEKDVNSLAYSSSDALRIGADASLSVAGVARVFADAKGLRKGDVLPGGTISLNAVTGFLIADTGASLDVSGAAPVTLDLRNAQGGFGVQLAGDAGRVSVSAREGLVFDATVNGQSGGLQSRGGSFDLTFGSKVQPPTHNPPYPTNERVLGIGGASPVVSAGLTALQGVGYVDVERLETSGFDSIKISSLDTIRFGADAVVGAGRSTPLGLVRFDAPQINLNGHAVSVKAAVVELGNYDFERQSAAPSGSSGSGLFSAAADFLELAGKTTWTGVSNLDLQSSGELRLTGVRANGAGVPTGLLNTQAGIHFSASVIAPSTLTDFVVQTPGDVTVSRVGVPLTPMSALGNITIKAENINHGGNIQAPYGSVGLEANNVLTLLDGSVTSVAGSSGITPLGMTVNGRSWIYDYGSSTQIIGSLGEKSVRLQGQTVNLRAGSRVDVSGRGELQAWEFTPGPGGSTDVLAGSGVYAIIPGYQGSVIPGDSQNAVDFDRATGSAVWLDRTSSLASGVYTLLPAHYALLPGAFLIKVAGASKDVLPGQGGAKVDGSMLVSGYLTDSRHAAGGPRDGRYSGFTLMPQSEVLKRSEFSLTAASTFFGDATSGRPGDAGSLVIDAGQALTLNSTFETVSLPGFRGAQVDLTAPKIAVVSEGGAATGGSGFLEIDVQSLNRLNAASLLLGGTRTTTAEGSEVRVGAQQIVIANNADAPLTGPELLFAAKEKITVKAGSVVEGRGTGAASNSAKLITGFRIADSNGSGTITLADDNRGDVNGDGQITALDSISGNGALLRVAAGTQAAFERRNVDRSPGVNTGEIIIEGALAPADGARSAALLRADGSLRIDATKETQVDGQLQLATGGALALGASRVSAGETAGVTEGLILSNARLTALGKPADFAIRSYSTLDLYGDAVLGDVTGGTDRIRLLTIEAGGIGGYANNGKTAVMAADTVILGNPDSTSYLAAASPGDGALRLKAQTVRLGSGGVESSPFEIRGFSSALIEAGREVIAQGRMELTAGMPLSIETARISTVAGADAKINANSGALTTTMPLIQPAELAAPGAGGKIVFSAPTIVHGTAIELPSGIVQLKASGNAGVDGSGSVSMMAGSSISVAGSEVRFFDVTRNTAGGTALLSSLNADVIVGAGAMINVSGAPGADAGSLAIQAIQGTVQLDGRVLGGSASLSGDVPRQGRFSLDVATLSDFNQLNQSLESLFVGGQVAGGGFGESRDLRVRNGNVSIGSASDAATTVTAQHFQLAADSGRIEVYGQINADGDKGGSVGLYAGNGVTLHETSAITARADAAGAAGGRVLLSTNAGNLDMAPGSQIDVSAGAQGRSGELQLRAPRNADNNNLNVSRFAGTVTGAGVISAEGFRSYTDTSIASADFSPTSTWFTEARDFMANSDIIKSGLGVAADDRFRVMPGLEVRSTLTPGSMVDQTLVNDWSMQSWRYDPDTGDLVTTPALLASGLSASGKPLIAGVMTLRSSGALNINGSLSDGFNGPTTAGIPQGLDSWSFRLVSGADLAAANPLAVKPGDSDLSLANNKLVRTGTGSIDMASADAIRMGNNQSVIYTAGRLVDAAERSGFVAMPVDAAGSGVTASDYLFTRNGGNISLNAGGDIEMVTTPLSSARQLYSNWLYRQGQVDAGNGQFDTTFTSGIRSDPQTAWWVRFDRFQQGIAALAGGDVVVTAGGSVKNVSLSSATQGFMTGVTPGADNLRVLGQGDVRVRAGGDLQGGQYWSGRGNVEISSDGAISSSNVTTTNLSTIRKLYPIVALGEGRAEVTARGDVELHGIIDPFLVVQDVGSGRNFVSVNQSTSASSRFTLFSSQNEETAAALTSINGSVRLHNPESSANSPTAAVGVQNAFSSLAGASNNNWNTNLYSASTDRPLALAPASLEATAYKGDVEVLNSLIMRPAAQGSLGIYAGRNVSLSGTLVLSDMDTARVPLATGNPSRDTGDLPAATASWRSHAELAPVHATDAEPVRIYAAGGSIAGKTNTVSLILAKSAQLRAAGDISDLGVEAQNLRQDDVTALKAGNDIRFTNQGIRARNAKIQVGGPGLVDIEAGRNLDLGASEGIVSRGDLDNAALPATGAAINVAVGVRNGVDYQGAVDRLVVALQAVVAAGAVLDDATMWQVRWLTGNNSISNAVAALAAVQAVDSLTDAAQRMTVRAMFYQALRDTGRDYNKAGSEFAGDYSRGYKTIELLFPGIDQRNAQGQSLNYKGEMNLFASRIRTERGGDIEFMAPGGQAVIGLAQLPDALAFYNPSSTVDRQPVPLGAVTVERGAIRGFTREDILVNQSRILTVGGGDIVLWSSESDIDAGKGKRTVTTVPPPIIKFDNNGNVSVELQGVATGSGIGALAGQPGVIAGDVDLIAPKGTVNAGEAGIRATNLNIAAQFVLNSQNIQVSGATTGAPVADSGGLSSGLAGNSVADQGQDAARALNNQSAEAQKTADEVRRALAAFNLISVEVLGFGDQ